MPPYFCLAMYILYINLLITFIVTNFSSFPGWMAKRSPPRSRHAISISGMPKNRSQYISDPCKSAGHAFAERAALLGPRQATDRPTIAKISVFSSDPTAVAAHRLQTGDRAKAQFHPIRQWQFQNRFLKTHNVRDERCAKTNSTKATHFGE